MSYRDSLVGFTLAAVGRAEDFKGLLVPNHFQVVPEGSGDAAIVGIAQGSGHFAVFDKLRIFAAELKLVAGVIYGPRRVGLHEDSVFDSLD